LYTTKQKYFKQQNKQKKHFNLTASIIKAMTEAVNPSEVLVISTAPHSITFQKICYLHTRGELNILILMIMCIAMSRQCAELKVRNT
jgi:hypothetical protein